MQALHTCKVTHTIDMHAHTSAFTPAEAHLRTHTFMLTNTCRQLFLVKMLSLELLQIASGEHMLHCTVFVQYCT